MFSHYLTRALSVTLIALSGAACLGSPESEPIGAASDALVSTCSSLTIDAACVYHTSLVNLYGYCGYSTNNGAPTCCYNGCVDANGYCRVNSGDATACGGAGTMCGACPAGESCTNNACTSACASPGGSCPVEGGNGKWGNGLDRNGNVTCVCCQGCFDPSSGLCTNAETASACGLNGSTCSQCGNGAPYCSNGTCVQCTADSQCDDGNPCTTDTCSAGSCQHAPLSSGHTSCGTNSWCTASPPGVTPYCCTNGCNVYNPSSGGYYCGTCAAGQSCVSGFCQ